MLRYMQHLVLECRHYAEEREQMKSALETRLPLSLQTFFYTRVGKKALAKFLIDTRVWSVYMGVVH